MVDGQDATIGLLQEGFARLRGEKSACQHFDDYKEAEEDARMSEVGIWNESKDSAALRRLKADANEEEIIKLYKGEVIKGIVEEVHPSKAVIFLPKDEALVTLNFSEIQAVVLSEKLPSKPIFMKMEKARVTFEPLDQYWNPLSSRGKSTSMSQHLRRKASTDI